MLDRAWGMGSRFRREQTAQGMAEYALIVGFVALVVLGAITLLGTNIKGTLNNIAGFVATAS